MANKIAAMFLILLVIQLGLYFFVFACDPTTGLDSVGNVCENNSLFNFFRFLYNLDENVLVVTLGLSLSVLGATIFIATTWIRSEFPIYAAIASSLIVTLLSSVVNLWQWIYSIPFLPDEGLKFLVAMLFTAPLGIFVLMGLVDWARGKD